MPKSDDAIEQTRAQYEEEPENLVMGLVKQGLEEIPFVGIAMSYVRGRRERKKKKPLITPYWTSLKSIR